MSRQHSKTNSRLLDHQLYFFNSVTNCSQFISDCLDKVVIHKTH